MEMLPHCGNVRREAAFLVACISTPFAARRVMLENTCRRAVLSVRISLFRRSGENFSFQLPPGRGPLLGGITGRRLRSGRLGPNKKNLGRRTVPGSFFSGHRPPCGRQARTRSLQSESQSSPLLILVEVRGVEPLSENNFTGFSPGADGHSRRLNPPCSPSGRQAVTPAGQVRVMMHGTVNSFRTHVHR